MSTSESTNASDIARKVTEAEGELVTLQGRVGAAAFAIEARERGAEAAFTRLNEQITVAQRRVAQLRAAHEVAVLHEEQAGANARHQARLAQLADFEAVVKYRGEVARKLAVALAAASEAYRVLVDTQESLPAFLPAGVAFDTGAAALFREQRPEASVVAEMWRISIEVDRGSAGARVALPGARAPGALYVTNPAATPSLVESVERSNGWLLEFVRNGVSLLEPAGFAQDKAA